MKKVLWLVAVLGFVAMAGQVYAGGGCCPSSKAKKSGYDSACGKALNGIELTAEQQEKIAKIEDDCKAEGMTKEACSKSMSKIRDVLSDEQRAQFDAASSKMAEKAGCGS